MIPDNIIYTDGHDVTITDTKFEVKHTSYKLNGIIKHGMRILKPRKVPGFITLIAGVLLAFLSFFVLIPSSTFATVQIGSSYVNINIALLWIGIGLSIAGLVSLLIFRTRYAVRIDTAEGEKNAIISTKKDYIAQIVDALNEAIYRLSPKYQTRETIVHQN